LINESLLTGVPKDTSHILRILPDCPTKR